MSALPERPEIVRPPWLIVPAVGVRMPASADSSVVFPQPDGPSRITSEPSGAWRLNLSIGRTT